MPVTIDFRGVMLFNCSSANGNLTNILIPDGEDVNDKWKSGKKHPDDSDARVHYAGLVVQPAGQLRIVHVPLKTAKVEIATAVSGSVTVELDGLPRLRPAVFGKGTPDANLATTQVSITGAGRLKQDPLLPTKVKPGKFLTRSVTHHGAQLITGNATITVKTFTHEERVELGGNDRAVFYNYEVLYPSLDELDQVGLCRSPEEPDHDFKWLYSLIGGWDKSNDLLAPMVRCNSSGDQAGAEYITVFTCFPAVWEEEVSMSAVAQESGRKSVLKRKRGSPARRR